MGREGAQSLDPDRLAAMTFSARQAKSMAKLAEHRGRQELFRRQAPDVLESLRALAMVESTECSNRIEGVTAPHDRIEALVRAGATPANRPEQELAGYRDALALIHGGATAMEFSGNVMLQLHDTMLRYTPESRGRWKRVDNQIVDVFPDGAIARVRFVPVPALRTPDAIEALVVAYREAVENQARDPLVVLPLAILDFLCIHPFQDGNGRVSRLLTLMLLYHAGIEVGRYISLERIIEQSKESYYEALKHASQRWHEGGHDVSRWLDYCWGVWLRAYTEFEERVRGIEKRRGAKTEHVRRAVLRRVGTFGIAEIESECPRVSRDMVRRILGQLRDEGVIERQGRGRYAKWLRRLK